MAKNLEIYEKFSKVPDGACKSFDNGKFKGTDINSMWRIKCLTEEFGVVGVGWTSRVVRTWTENAANGEVLAFAEIAMKVKVDGVWSEEWTATGGNTMVKYVKSRGECVNSDEAFKMAITDAFGVACKYLGIGADIYWANDRSKYTDSQVEEKPIKKCSAEQLKKMRELNVLETNVCKWAKVSKLEDLSCEQADFVIKSKEKNDGANN